MVETNNEVISSIDMKHVEKAKRCCKMVRNYF